MGFPAIVIGCRAFFESEFAMSTTNPVMNLKAAQAKTAEPEIKGSVFFGEFGLYENFMTPTGKVLSFYKGFAVVEDPELIEYAKTIKGLKDVTKEVKVSDLPVQPVRSRTRNFAANGIDPTVFNPLDLLQRAVASSQTVTQAADSNSGQK